MHTGKEWFVAVHYVGISLRVNSDNLKGIVCNALFQKYKFWRNEIGIYISHEGSKLFNAISRAFRVISMWLSLLSCWKLKPFTGPDMENAEK